MSGGPSSSLWVVLLFPHPPPLRVGLLDLLLLLVLPSSISFGWWCFPQKRAAPDQREMTESTTTQRRREGSGTTYKVRGGKTAPPKGGKGSTTQKEGKEDSTNQKEDEGPHQLNLTLLQLTQVNQTYFFEKKKSFI